MRSSVIGVGERAKEPRESFLLMEKAIKQPEIAESVQVYQLAVDQAKVRLKILLCALGRGA